MNKITKYIVYPCLFLGASACTNLDEDLKGDITNTINTPGVDTDTGGGGDALSAAFGTLRAGTANHGSYYSIQELTSDEMCIGAKGGDWFDGGILIELHRHTYTPGHDMIKNTWNDTYGSINTVNEALKGTTLDENQKAQARVLRAYYHLRLMDLYGRVKIATESGASAQVSRQEVFAFVEKEILEALGISSLTSGLDFATSKLTASVNAYRINRYGALGILAKLYLNSEVYTGTPRYDKAAIAASYIIDSGVYSLCGDACKVKNLGRRNAVATDPTELTGYAAVFAPNNQGNPEHIFSVEYDAVTAQNMNFSQMNLHYSSQFTYNLESQPWNGYQTLEEFYNSYEAGDARKANNFLAGKQLDFGGSQILDYASDDGNIELNYTPKINELAPNSCRECGVRASKFSYKQLGRNNMDNDYPIVRLGEVYLIRAEALARASNNWNAAIPDANAVRTRAKVAAYTSLTADEFLKERGREMFVEGVRRTDLIRFGKFNDAWWEKPVSPATKNVFPIPQTQIDLPGSGLTQNEGY